MKNEKVNYKHKSQKHDVKINESHEKSPIKT